MITSQSRYVTGRIVPMNDGQVVAYRTFPRLTQDPLVYTWKASDRLDRVAARHMGSPDLWWKIMDANPMIQNPHEIRPGMQIRIPRRV